jgi:CheY-like chemotaxis protein
MAAAPKYKALLLEDEPIICRIVTRTLAMRGISVDVAENGLIAKEKINAGNDYDFLLLDIKTPVISGIQLYEYLEKQRPELTAKVVFTTGDSLNFATRTFLKKVKRPFLFKPYTPTELQSILMLSFNIK